MPHKTTLNQYTGYFSTGAGYHVNVIQNLYEETKTLPPQQKQCSIVFDEMKVKCGLVFNKHDDRIIGFAESGDFNAELKEFEDDLNDSSKEHMKPLATHILSLMVRGITFHINYPIAYFPTCTADGDELFPILWEGVRVVESIGIQVRSFICDGASQNRKFFRLHKLEDGANKSPEGVTYWITNRYAPDRKIDFFSDPPHLMKTLRNCVENSGPEKARHLMVNTFFFLYKIPIQF